MSATIPCMKSFVGGFTTGGVGYVIDPNAGRVLTNTTVSNVRSEESYELGKLRGRAKFVRLGTAEGEGGSNDRGVEAQQDGSRRISARLSRVWNGPGHANGVVHSEGSEAPMVRRMGDGERRESV